MSESDEALQQRTEKINALILAARMAVGVAMKEPDPGLEIGPDVAAGIALGAVLALAEPGLLTPHQRIVAAQNAIVPWRARLQREAEHERSAEAASLLR